MLHKRSQPFYQTFAARIARSCAARTDVDIRPVLEFASSQAPDDFRAAIETVARSAGVVAATAINHASLSRLVERLAADGRPVFALLNDFAGPAGAGYFGLDNLRAGRVAGWMMAKALRGPGRVAVFTGGSRWHGQTLRDEGFRRAIRTHGPGIEVTDTVINLETRQVTYEATIGLLDRQPDLGGIYVAGGGMEGAIEALRERRPPGKVALVVNELTADSRKALAEGYATLVVATPLEELCDALVSAMVERTRQGGGPGDRIFEPRLYLPESV